MNAATLTPLLTTPIAGDSPAGADLSYEPHFQRLAEEVEKGRSLAGQTPDWRVVLEDGSRILREESKDLRVAAWVVVATSNLAAWSGASDGLAAYAEMIDALWDVALPTVSRPRARVSLAEWLWEGLERSLIGRPAKAADRDALNALLPLIARVDEAFSSRLKKEIEGAGKLRKLVRQNLEALPAPAAPPIAPVAAAPPPREEEPAAIEPVAAPAAAAAPPPERPAPPAARVAPPPPPDIVVDAAIAPASLDDAEAIASRLRSPIGALARYVRQAAPASPWGYRLARISAWLAVEDLPYVEKGRTTQRAPATADRTALERMAKDGDWADLLSASEDAFPEHVYWLDLHRFTSLALDGLGAAHAAARATVVRELVMMLARIPDLVGQRFANDTPFASAETVSWIEQEKTRLTGGRGGDAGEDAAASQVAELLTAARKHVEAGGGESAIAAAIAAAQLPRARPDRFRATLGVANLALANGKRDAALALFERLFPEVNETLEAWVPTVCTEFYEGYLKALGTSPDAELSRDRQTLLFRRLLALNPLSAFRYGG